MSTTPRRLRSAGFLTWLPAAFIATGTALNLVTPPHLSFVGLFAAAPLVAAALGTLRATVITGVVANVVLFLLILVKPGPLLSMAEIVVRLGATTLIAVFAVVMNRMLIQRNRRVASARSVAEAVQRAVVPAPPPRVGPLRIATRYHAAQLEARIGGDLYAAVDTPFGVRLVMGDVRGKGLGATEAVAVVLGAFREWAAYEPDLPSLAFRVEKALIRESQQRAVIDPYEGFITAVLVEVEHGPPYRLRAVNRGHPPPLLLSAHGPPRYLEPREPALPLGMGALSPAPESVETAPFPGGTYLLLYTDGVSEARDSQGAFYDPADALRGRSFPGVEALVEQVTAEVMAHTRAQLRDDMAMLAAERLTSHAQ